jgi:hypothetical protein
MSAVDDLTELVECVGAAERAALASKWKQRSDVEALRRQVQRTLDEQRNLERRSTAAATLTGRGARLRAAFLDGDVDDREGPAREGDAASAPDPARRAPNAAPHRLSSPPRERVPLPAGPPAPPRSPKRGRSATRRPRVSSRTPSQR